MKVMVTQSVLNGSLLVVALEGPHAGKFIGEADVLSLHDVEFGFRMAGRLGSASGWVSYFDDVEVSELHYTKDPYDFEPVVHTSDDSHQFFLERDKGRAVTHAESVWISGERSGLRIWAYKFATWELVGRSQLEFDFVA